MLGESIAPSMSGQDTHGKRHVCWIVHHLQGPGEVRDRVVVNRTVFRHDEHIYSQNLSVSIHAESSELGSPNGASPNYYVI